MAVCSQQSVCYYFNMFVSEFDPDKRFMISSVQIVISGVGLELVSSNINPGRDKQVIQKI